MANQLPRTAKRRLQAQELALYFVVDTGWLVAESATDPTWAV